MSLNRLVCHTLCYYDVMEMPLSSFEVWKHLLNTHEERPVISTLAQVMRVLDEEVESGHIVCTDGMYTLPRREHLVEVRYAEDKISTTRLKQVRRLVRWLRFVPFVRMIGVTGSLSIKHSGSESDWDLFLVLRGGYIFTGRTVVTGVLQLLGKRRYGTHVRNRACLNYFVTEEGLEIGVKDLFAAHEYRFLIPFFGFEVFRRFERHNVWMQHFKPNMLMTEARSLWEVPDTAVAKSVRRCGEWLLAYPLVERWLAVWQKQKIARNPNTHLPGSLIEASASALVFLPKPRGPRVFEAFKHRLSEHAIF